MGRKKTNNQKHSSNYPRSYNNKKIATRKCSETPTQRTASQETMYVLNANRRKTTRCQKNATKQTYTRDIERPTSSTHTTLSRHTERKSNQRSAPEHQRPEPKRKNRYRYRTPIDARQPCARTNATKLACTRDSYRLRLRISMNTNTKACW